MVVAVSVATDALMMERMVSSLDAFVCRKGRAISRHPIGLSFPNFGSII